MSGPRFLPISVATLEPSDSLAWDLYLLPRDSAPHILYRAVEQPLDTADLQRLINSGVSRLFIPGEQRASYQQYLRENVDSWLGNSATPPAARMETLNQVVSGSLNDAFRRKLPPEQLISETKQFGQQTAAFLEAETIALGDLFRVLQHDFTTFVHSANVCFYSVLLAKELSIGGDDLAGIATGALLHDLGKLEIDERLLAKDNRLSVAETREMQKHPALGFRRLCHQNDLSAAQLMMVYQHHERLDGGGYPVGIVGNEIHPWAKLCSVVDVFDALTSDRPYRAALSNLVALEIIERDVNTAFDPEITACWKQLITASDNN
jgi:HD-GYP domain-containing protein (c-di-GMP phosphodiesterase class II)